MTDKQFERRISMIQSGDKQGLKEIYAEYGKMIYQCAFQILHNKQDAEDVTSDFFMKLWKIADTYCFGGRHKRWLATIARNMALDALKKKSRESLSLDGEDAPEQPCGGSAEETVIGSIAVAEALKRLDDSEREIVNLRIFADMPFKDIAAVLKKPLGTVTWKYRNAILKLRENIGEAGSV